jgi:hypothetical protein
MTPNSEALTGSLRFSPDRTDSFRGARIGMTSTWAMRVLTEPLIILYVGLQSYTTTALQSVADLLKRIGEYRWVGFYDVDRPAGVVRNIVWSGLGQRSTLSYNIRLFGAIDFEGEASCAILTPHACSASPATS